jgi:hypothetical protein
LRATVTRLTNAVSDLIVRLPWAGWAGCFIFCAIALARVTPRQFASTFGYYIKATERLAAPRNEFLSFLVPARDQGDWRGWLLIVAALVLGMWWSLAFDAVAKPAILIAIGGWLAWLMVKPEALVRTDRSSQSHPLNCERMS